MAPLLAQAVGGSSRIMPQELFVGDLYRNFSKHIWDPGVSAR